MNTSTEHILQCNQSEQLADASGRIVDLMNENGLGLLQSILFNQCLRQMTSPHFVFPSFL